MRLRFPVSLSLASLKRFIPIVIVTFALTFIFHFFAANSATSTSHPKIVPISLDGATPPLLDRYLATEVLNKHEGLGLLRSQGLVAKQNQTITPSLTAPAHIAIGTGSTTTRNDINANSFHLVASPFKQNLSGFAAPIGGYSV